MNRILVTGANGQLGRQLQEVAKNSEFDWIFAGRDRLDVTDKEAVMAFFEKERPDLVVNCAAYTDVDKAESERGEAFRINRDGLRFLTEAAAGNDASIIHISTDYLFDGRKDTPYDESDIPIPINVYGESKLAGARIVLESGCRGAVVRTSWLYSPVGHSFVRSIVDAASQNPEIKVVSDQRGCPTSAISLARAILKMIPVLLAETESAEVYHYCDSGVVSRAGFAEEIIKLTGLKCRVVHIPSSESSSVARRPAYSAMDTTKFTRDFGIVPPSWKDELKECLNAMGYGR